ncbi:hypothetical protein [Glycomyces harbinensis]|uniref:hypothetical protein n=1 Tax=Glycomyces harbinensis TaxID=58114 RepID=UPI0015A70155|nr:hypothetical protein [Glycomyces harbinensis]
MSAPSVILLAIAIPSGALALFALVFFLLGRRMRRLRREGRVTYSAKTSSDSNANFTG